MGHCAFSAIKGMHSHYYIMASCSQGWGVSSRRANNHWGDVCKAQTWRRWWTDHSSFVSSIRRTMYSHLWHPKSLGHTLYFLVCKLCLPYCNLHLWLDSLDITATNEQDFIVTEITILSAQIQALNVTTQLFPFSLPSSFGDREEVEYQVWVQKQIKIEHLHTCISIPQLVIL